MRLQQFSQLLGSLARNAAGFEHSAGPGQQNTEHGVGRTQRLIMSAYRKQLDPALNELRRFGHGEKANRHSQVFGRLRKMPAAWWEVQRQLDQLAQDVNDSLQESAAFQSMQFTRFDGHIESVSRVREMDLGDWHAKLQHDTYNLPNLVFKGWMTREACKKAGAIDFETLHKIFMARHDGKKPDGARLAPKDGFPHIHVNGDPHNIVAYDDQWRVISFTDHMDGTKKGERECAIATRNSANALISGWVWVALEKTPTQALRLVQLTL